MNAKAIIAIALTFTVCATILAVVVGALFYPPGTVPETTRVKMFELLTFILGVVSGYLLNSKPDQPPSSG